MDKTIGNCRHLHECPFLFMRRSTTLFRDDSLPVHKHDSVVYIFEHPSVWDSSKPIQNIPLSKLYWEGRGGRIRGSSHPQLHRKFKANLGYIKLPLNLNVFLSSIHFLQKVRTAMVTSHSMPRKVKVYWMTHWTLMVRTSFPVLWKCSCRTPTRCRSPLQ